MEKQCLICGSLMIKPLTKSKKDWDTRSKYCSRNCSGIGNFNRNRLGAKHSKETRQKMSEAHKGVKLSAERIKKMGESKTGNKYRLGSKWTQKQRELFLPQVSGKNNYNWKGGYENRLMHVKQRRVRKMNADGFHTLREWETLKAQYNWNCPCCKKQEPEIKLTEDHIVPLIKGGSDNIENIQPLCKSCNSRKHTNIIKYELQ